MKHFLVVAMVLPLAGCVIYSGPDGMTHSETVSNDGQTTTHTTATSSHWGVGSKPVRDSAGWLEYPIYSRAQDICDIALVVLSAERARGEIQPVDHLFWDRDIRTGPDCASEIFTAGFSAAESEQAKQHMVLPRQLPDGRVYFEIDGNCTKRCQSGTGYAVRKRDNGQWQIDQTLSVSWNRP